MRGYGKELHRYVQARALYTKTITDLMPLVHVAVPPILLVIRGAPSLCLLVFTLSSLNTLQTPTDKAFFCQQYTEAKKMRPNRDKHLVVKLAGS